MRLTLVLVVACAAVVMGKRFSQCELASELENRYKMTRDDIKNWVCIAEHESTFNTAAVNHFNYDGSKDYGLFQLNSKYWCDNGGKGKNECQMPCTDLLDDDLTDDLQCIEKIIRDTERWKGKGTALTAWVAYVNKCQNRNLDEYMDKCWRNTIASNIIPANTPPRIEPEGYVPIINNARVPIRPKVISNMHPPYNRHPSYLHVPMYNPFSVQRPYPIFYQRNY